MQRGGRVRGAAPQKPSGEAPGVVPGHIPAPPGAEAIIAANAAAAPAEVYYTPSPQPQGQFN